MHWISGSNPPLPAEDPRKLAAPAAIHEHTSCRGVAGDTSGARPGIGFVVLSCPSDAEVNELKSSPKRAAR